MAQGRPENTPLSFQNVSCVSVLLRNAKRARLLETGVVKSAPAPSQPASHVRTHHLVKRTCLSGV